MVHNFDPIAYEVRKQARRDYEAHKAANPNPNTLPKLAERVQLLEKLLNV